VVERALASLQGAGKAHKVYWPPSRAFPTLVRGLELRVPGPSLRARVDRFLAEHPGMLLPVGAQLETVDVRSTNTRQVIRVQQLHRGIPVLGKQILFSFDQQRRLRAIHADTAHVDLATSEAAITPLAAAGIAYRVAGGGSTRAETRRRLGQASAKLVIVADAETALAYQVVLPLTLDMSGRFHLVDARNGRYLGNRLGLRWEPSARMEPGR
jgi:Zn-dependent metalloprotease